jgi:hypothetical protein
MIAAIAWQLRRRTGEHFPVQRSSLRTVFARFSSVMVNRAPGATSERLTSLPLPLDVGHFTLPATWHARFDGDPAHNWLRKQLAASASN